MSRISSFTFVEITFFMTRNKMVKIRGELENHCLVLTSNKEGKIKYLSCHLKNCRQPV